MTIETSGVQMPAASADLSRKAAIVGIGETDYALDYAAARKRAEGYQPPAPEDLATLAFERALADSGLQRSDIDGLCTAFLYGGPDAAETAQRLGIQPRFQIQGGGLMAGPLPAVCAAIAEGRCDTVAMIYAVASRAIGRRYGGATYDSGGAPRSYNYYHPWGWSSQAAHWALVWQHYQNCHGATPSDLGTVAIQLRENARLHPDAVMRKPLTLEDYLGSRFIVEPLRLFDLCLVNDGGVCLIVRRADRARGLAHAPVTVAGWSDAKISGNKLHGLMVDRLQTPMQKAANDLFAMAGRHREEVQHFEGYDASTIHLVCQIEGFGLAEPGRGIERVGGAVQTAPGKLPVNTAGGMLSGSYMHGWNHVAEITRQLRHEAGERQIPDLSLSLFSVAQTDQVHPVLFERGQP